jgi:hypothetical protein
MIENGEGVPEKEEFINKIIGKGKWTKRSLSG